VEAAWERFSNSAPTLVAAREGLPPERFEEMESEIVALFRREAGPEGPFEIANDYLLIVARKRG
jgi:hypothetical protein